MAKLLENIFRSVNIALVNELAILANRMDLDIWEVVDAAATKPYGFMRFEPGPGMGGHCLPVDPFYLTWRAREFHMSTEFIELAGKVNQQMPLLLRGADRARAQRRGEAGARLADRDPRRQLKGGVGDIRESPALRIIEVLTERGAALAYHDPYVAQLPDHGLTSTPLAQLLDSDAVVLVTAHPDIDHGALSREARLFVDLRGTTRGSGDASIVRL